MRCSFKEWPFKIVFKSNELGTGFKSDLVLSAQYNKHTDIPNLLIYFYCISYEMDLQKINEFRSEIDKKINLTMIISNWMEY